MEYIYATLLLHSAKKQVTEENLQKVIDATGIKFDGARAKALISALSGVNIDEVLKSATTMAVAAQAAAPAQAALAAAAPAKKEEKKEEEAVEGLSALFG